MMRPRETLYRLKMCGLDPAIAERMYGSVVARALADANAAILRRSIQRRFDRCCHGRR